MLIWRLLWPLMPCMTTRQTDPLRLIHQPNPSACFIRRMCNQPKLRSKKAHQLVAVLHWMPLLVSRVVRCLSRWTIRRCQYLDTHIASELAMIRQISRGTRRCQRLYLQMQSLTTLTTLVQRIRRHSSSTFHMHRWVRPRQSPWRVTHQSVQVQRCFQPLDRLGQRFRLHQMCLMRRWIHNWLSRGTPTRSSTAVMQRRTQRCHQRWRLTISTTAITQHQAQAMLIQMSLPWVTRRTHKPLFWLWRAIRQWR